MSGQYNYIYRVSLFDDIHNYFPEILYGSPTRFGSVDDLLLYVRQQVRWHSDLYRIGQDSYNRLPQDPRRPVAAAEAPVAAPVPLPTAVPPAVPAPAPAQQRQPNLNPWFSSNPSSPSYTTGSSTTTGSPDVSPIRNNNIVPLPPPVPNRPVYMRGTANLLDGVRPHVIRNDVLGTNLFDNLMNIFMQPNVPGATTISIFGTGLTDAALENALRAASPVVVHPSNEQIDEATTILTAASEHLQSQCMVCLEQFVVGQELRKIDFCNHIFHKSCIDTWFERNVRCPMCRHDIRGEEFNQEPSEGEDDEGEVEEEQEQEEYDDNNDPSVDNYDYSGMY